MYVRKMVVVNTVVSFTISRIKKKRYSGISAPNFLTKIFRYNHPDQSF